MRHPGTVHLVRPTSWGERGEMRSKLGILLALSVALGAGVLGVRSAAADSVAETLASARPPAAERGLAPEPGRFYLTRAEIALMRKSVSTNRWARVAWNHVKLAADRALRSSPQPAPRDKDYSRTGSGVCGDADDGWTDCLYGPGLRDGHDARNLALAFAISGERRYALKAKDILLAWARTYNPLPPPPGHNVAEPVGFMLKGFMAFDLTRQVFSPAEVREFRAWAKQFVERGMTLADAARDRPWVPEAPFGNGATWPRALAVLAAAAVGGETLKRTLRWNWQHTTSGGRPYGWLDLVDGVMGRGGRMVEERVRQSITYGLYTWAAMALIADVAAHAGFERDLWRATTRDGKNMYRPVVAYAPFLLERVATPHSGEVDTQHPAKLAQYRAVMEVARKAYPKSRVAKRIVAYGGDKRRGSNYDYHIVGWNALAGR